MRVNSGFAPALFGLVLLVGVAAAPGHGDGTRPTALARYGLTGHIQPVGLHHGFHVESVQVDSAADADQVMPHDVIVKVDGDVIRSLDHLRAVMAEAYADDGEVSVTYTRGPSLVHHVAKYHLRTRPVQPVVRKPRPAEDAGTATIR